MEQQVSAFVLGQDRIPEWVHDQHALPGQSGGPGLSVIVGLESMKGREANRTVATLIDQAPLPADVPHPEKIDRADRISVDLREPLECADRTGEDAREHRSSVCLSGRYRSTTAAAVEYIGLSRSDAAGEKGASSADLIVENLVDHAYFESSTVATVGESREPPLGSRLYGSYESGISVHRRHLALEKWSV